MGLIRSLRRRERRSGRRAPSWSRLFRAERVRVAPGYYAHTYVAAGEDVPLSTKGRRRWRLFWILLVACFVGLLLYTLIGR
jgi:hypothetical protein